MCVEKGAAMDLARDKKTCFLPLVYMDQTRGTFVEQLPYTSSSSMGTCGSDDADDCQYGYMIKI
jgi:hypothetical protein